MTEQQMKELKDFIRKEINACYIWLVIVISMQFAMHSIKQGLQP